MLSKNNNKELMRKQEPKKQRFAIKKLTVGVASVLIGFTFMGLSVSAHADDATTAPANTEAVAGTQNGDSTSASAQPQAKPTNATGLTENKAEQQVTIVNNYDQFSQAFMNKDVSVIKLGQDIDLTNLTKNEANALGQNGLHWKGDSELTTGTDRPIIDNHRGDGIGRALTIDGQGQYTLNMGGKFISLWDNNIDHGGSAWKITLKDLTLTDANTWGKYSPIRFYVTKAHADQCSLALDGATLNLTNSSLNENFGAAGTNANSVKLILQGNNTINSNQTGNYSGVYANGVEVLNGTTNVYAVNQAPSNGAGANNHTDGAAFQIKSGNFVIDDGATVNINGKTQSGDATKGKDVLGIRFDTPASASTIDSATSGKVQLGKNANLNFDMADGHSIAIIGNYVDLGEGSQLSIKTKQNNQNMQAGDLTTNTTLGGLDGTHMAPISLGVHTDSPSNQVRVGKNATLSIIRTADKSSTPLISFGNVVAGGNQTDTFTVNEGATVDLQDSVTYPQATGGPVQRGMVPGIITMYGSSSNDNLEFNNPQYVNLQRTNNLIPEQQGNLIRLEGTTNGNEINSNSGIPVSQWDRALMGNTPSFTWYIKNENSSNPWGNDSVKGFVPTGKSSSDNGLQGQAFINSNGGVTMAPNQAGKDSYAFVNGVTMTGVPDEGQSYYTPYMNSFLNHFNWWTAQRISIGTPKNSDNTNPKIDDNSAYQPTVTTIPGTTNQTLTDLDPNNGITGLVDGTGAAVPNYKDKIQNVAWYNPSTDENTWNQQMLNADGTPMAEPTNPTGKLTIADDSAWAKVTYEDGTVDFVNIPLNIKTEADQNDPKGQNVPTTVGTVPEAKLGIKNVPDMPSDATYTWANTPDVSKPGVVPAIVNVTYGDGSQDQVPVNVIVKDADGNVPTTDPTKDNGKYDPQGKEISTTIGTPVDPSTTITWPNGTPTDGTPTYAWSTEPDIWSQGQHPGVVKVTYHDGTSDLVPVTVDVTNAPSGKNTTVPQNGTLPDPSTVITWTKSDGTPTPAPTDPHVTYTWTTSPDTTTPGNKTGVVTITYPNGEKTQVPVPVTVTPTVTTGSYDPYVDPQNYPYDPTGATPAVPAVNLPSGETAPTNVHYDWGTKPDTTKGNTTQTATVVATYPDPADPTKTITKTIPVIVHIGSMADKYDPKASDLEVPFNADMSQYPASAQISNVPTDVHHTDVWAPMPVTSVSGTQPTMIKVTYDDGSFDYVPLNVKVDDNQKLSDKYPVHYNDLNVVRPTDSSTASQSVDPTLAVNTPAGAITGYEIPANFTAPANVTVHVDPTTGKVTATAVKNSKLGSFNVPVNVTYSDQLSNGQPDTVTVYVPVSITGEDHNGNYYGDQIMTQCKGSVPVLHKTTGSNSIDPNDASISKLQTITYNYDWDHTNGNGHYKAYKTFKLNAAGTGYYLAEVGTQDDADVNRVVQHTYTEANTPTKFDDVNATWTWRNAAGHAFVPSTNVDAFGGNTGDTLYKNANGSVNEDEQTGQNDPTGLAGNSKWRMDYKIANTDFLRAAGLPSFYGTTGSWVNTYFDFLGATAKSGLTAHVGADVPTDTTGIEGYLNMGTLPTATPENGSLTSVTWAPGKEPGQNGKFVQGANRGTARLIFNGDPSNYLDIPVTIAADANHVTPTDPGVNPDHPDDQHKDLFMSVTRKVFVNGTQNASLTQTIRYARDKYTDTDGNVISYGAWKIGKVESGRWVNTPTAAATFAQETAPSEAGKDTYVQYGDDASTKTKTNVINAENVKNSTDAQGYVTPQDGTPVYVTYQNTPATDVKVTYTFHDDTDNKTVGAPVVVTGDEGQTKSTGLVIPNGYKLAEGQTLPSTVTIPASDKNVTIHLVHNTKTVTPGEPGVTPDKPEYKDLFAKSTRTINVHNPETNQIDPHEQTVEFGRTGVLDEATGKFLPDQFGAWKVYNNNALTNDTTGTWAAYTAPTFTGYTASLATVAEQTGVTPNQNVTVDINYSSNGGEVTPPATTKASVTYKFHDDTDNKTVGTPVVVTGDEGQVLPTGLVIPNGYKLAEGQTLPTTVTIPGTDETVTIHLVHSTKTVTPGEPGVTPTDPSNPAYKDLFKSVTRTINVVNPITGETEPHEETVEFGRTGVWDEADGKFTSFGDWYVYNTADNTLTDEATGTWNEFDAPEFSGYTPSQAVVEAKTVNATTPDETVTITYSKTNDGDNGNGGNTNPTPTPGDNNNNNQGNNGGNNGNGNGNGNGGITTDNNNNGNNGNKAQAKTLPQTGNESNAASVAGLGLASVMAMLGLSGYKKREDK